MAKATTLDISTPHRGTIRMIDLLKRAGVLLTERQTVLPELSVTSNLPSMMNGGKDFCEWSRRDKELAKSIGKVISLVLGKYGKGLVNLALAESFFHMSTSISYLYNDLFFNLFIFICYNSLMKKIRSAMVFISFFVFGCENSCANKYTKIESSFFHLPK